MADDLPHETFDATDPAAENNVKRDAARREREDGEVVRSIMETKIGRSFVYRWLTSCHIYHEIFEPDASDTIAFRLGQRAMGARLLDLCMDTCADLYLQMMREAKQEEAREQSVRESESKRREESATGPINVADLMNPLPPPAGYPGGMPLPKKHKDI